MLKFISNCLLITLFSIFISGCGSANNKDIPTTKDKPIMTTVTVKVSDKNDKPLKNIKAVEDLRSDKENMRATIGHETGTTDKTGNIKRETETGKYDVILYNLESKNDSHKYTINITEDTTTIKLVYKL
ncbi:DUF2606 family protein [Bacillus glycinifermentans]|uniref:DUF2606 family protein n=1 Tax=Bacillus glycinifermentans TaxID=1664069 RepID=A0A0T6BNR9_9BACI|nr:DUF2606 family protein [Bacillus glycinifermentans]ATH95113.1 DUF2606 domain-containing protein [Bacillus glycinifermentans]KRT93303.1 hypothetical protein AB447_220380 [Bacillus glycinifermentans]MEC0487512.1 DUF2606 family protein [Bacillus glycinifermentans]